MGELEKYCNAVLHILVFYAEKYLRSMLRLCARSRQTRVKAKPCDEGRHEVGMAQISIVGQPLEDLPRIPSRRSFPKNLKAIADIRCEMVLTD